MHSWLCARKAATTTFQKTHVEHKVSLLRIDRQTGPHLNGLCAQSDVLGCVPTSSCWSLTGGDQQAIVLLRRNMRGDEARKHCPELQLVQVPTSHGKADLTIYRNSGSKVHPLRLNNCCQVLHFTSAMPQPGKLPRAEALRHAQS